jgi:hypothetical protein
MTSQFFQPASRTFSAAWNMSETLRKVQATPWMRSLRSFMVGGRRGSVGVGVGLRRDHLHLGHGSRGRKRTNRRKRTEKKPKVPKNVKISTIVGE